MFKDRVMHRLLIKIKSNETKNKKKLFISMSRPLDKFVIVKACQIQANSLTFPTNQSHVCSNNNSQNNKKQAQ